MSCLSLRWLDVSSVFGCGPLILLKLLPFVFPYHGWCKLLLCPRFDLCMAKVFATIRNIFVHSDVLISPFYLASSLTCF